MRPAFSGSRRRFLAAGAGAATLATAGAWVGTRRAAPNGVQVLRGNTMASSYTVKLHAPGLDAGGVAEAHAAVERELAAIVGRMSSFEFGSELSRFNRHASERPVEVSAELAQVLVTARSMSEASDGHFDITIAPVVDAWGFGPRGVRARPAADDLARARAAVDWRALDFDPARGTLAKGHPMLAIDLSGIAQGHGADRVAQTLERLGFTDYLVDICGEMRASGVNAQNTPWRIGIERPDAPTRTAHRIVALDRGALATSGDYRIYFEQEGQRYSHEIDPRTGAPARHALASVSVVAADAARADAWATALFVAGPQAGYELAVARGLAAYFIERRGDGLGERSTPAFAALRSEKA